MSLLLGYQVESAFGHLQIKENLLVSCGTGFKTKHRRKSCGTIKKKKEKSATYVENTALHWQAHTKTPNSSNKTPNIQLKKPKIIVSKPQTFFFNTTKNPSKPQIFPTKTQNFFYQNPKKILKKIQNMFENPKKISQNHKKFVKIPKIIFKNPK